MENIDEILAIFNQLKTRLETKYPLFKMGHWVYADIGMIVFWNNSLEIERYPEVKEELIKFTRQLKTQGFFNFSFASGYNETEQFGKDVYFELERNPDTVEIEKRIIEKFGEREFTTAMEKSKMRRFLKNNA